MSSSTRSSHRSKPKNKGNNRHTTERQIELESGIENTMLRINYLQMTIKLNALRFQIKKMANAEANGSLSLLEESPTSKPAMSQELNEDGVMVFKCAICQISYKHLKRLQNHLKQKHNMSVDLDDTVVSGSFNPEVASTLEDAVSVFSPAVKTKVEAEPTKPKESRKRVRDDSDDEDDSLEMERHFKEKEKRAKVFEDLADKFEADIGDHTMENALEEVEASLINVGPTQAMTDKISQKIKEAEEELISLEKDLDDSLEKDESKVKISLQKQLEVKDNLLSCKDSKIIDQEDLINELKAKLDEKDKIIKGKKALIKEKDKELKEVVKKAKSITVAAGKSPSKEILKEKCLRHERSIENLQGRLKNLAGKEKENPILVKMEKTIQAQVVEIDSIKDTLADFEAKEAKLKKKIPCENKQCPLGRKKCPFNHDLEYKRPSEINQKMILCKYFAGRGCHLDDESCRFSHSLELLANLDAQQGGQGASQHHQHLPVPERSATGGNRQQLGQRDSFNDNSGYNNIANHRVRKVSQGQNNNMSVEIVDDLRHLPLKDARRTLLHNRSKNSDEDVNRHEPTNSWPGNGQGGSTWRPHQDAPREMRSFRNHSHQDQRSGDMRRDWQSQDSTSQRGRHHRQGDQDRRTRSNYEREPSFNHHQQPKRRRY